MKKQTISIGIPAYNEEKTIARLLQDIYAQNLGDYILHEVIVVSDGSEDDTVKIVKSLKHPTLTVIDRKQRKGIATGLNDLCKKSTGDCLVIFNADVRIKDAHCVEKLAQPILSGEADLTSCNQLPFTAQTLVEKALATSIEIKTAVFENYLHGDNVYTCHGTARGFSKQLYKKIHFPHSVGEDAYAYFFATYNQMPYSYVKDTAVYYKLPTTLEDHHKQNQRFMQSKSQFVEEFGELFMRRMYYLPQTEVIKETLKKAISAPISTVVFIGIFFLMKLKISKNTKTGETWDIALTSKETE